MTDFEAVLRRQSLRVTASRREVFAILSIATHPLSLREIAERCPAIDRSSVYRTIDAYVGVGIVKAVHIGWKKQYELTELFSPHHHHFHCTVCDRLTHVSDRELEDVIEAVSKRYSFKLSSHHFEIEGICQVCQATSA